MNDVHSKIWLISAGFGIGPVTKTMAEVKRPGLIFRESPEGLPLVETLIVWKRSNAPPAPKTFFGLFWGGWWRPGEWRGSGGG